MNGCAPGLALIERLKATRKWAISLRLPRVPPRRLQTYTKTLDLPVKK